MRDEGMAMVRLTVIVTEMVMVFVMAMLMVSGS
mgnify:CR=1 FL=1